MNNLLVAALITLCVNFGVRQRYMPFASLTTPRQKRLLYGNYIIWAAINVAALTAALHTWGVMVAFNYLRFGGIVYAAGLSLVNILVIPGRIREHLFVFGAVLTCNYLLLSIPNYLVTILPVLHAKDDLLVVLTTYVAVLLLSHVPLQKLLCNTVEPFLHIGNVEYWNTVWYMPITLFATKFLYLGGEHNVGDILQLISSMLYIGVIVLMCISIAAAHKRIRDQEIMEAQLALQKLHYNELRVKVEEARKARHDFKHHVAAIRHYIDMDDKDGLQGYCDELAQRDDTQVRTPYTGNTAVDGVLYHYMQQAQQNQIRFDYSGVIRSSGIADVDLCALLGNALDNALTACLTVLEGRSITVISQTEKQLLSIVVRNSFDGKVNQIRGTLLSRKRENSPGIGISSMESICKRYGGNLEMQWDDRNFTVMFLLPLQDT